MNGRMRLVNQFSLSNNIDLLGQNKDQDHGFTNTLVKQSSTKAVDKNLYDPGFLIKLSVLDSLCCD